ncbi:MAG: hypothetical protein ACKESB_03425 [Candidatus Hodgkinia cicadicola]
MPASAEEGEGGGWRLGVKCVEKGEERRAGGRTRRGVRGGGKSVGEERAAEVLQGE